VIRGLILALTSAVATNLAFLFKHRGAVLAPPIGVRHPLRSAAGLFRSRWFLVGWIVAIVAWGLHVGALSLAPLSIVQAVLSGGLVFLAVFAERFFGFQLGRRQWVGVTITAAGLVVIGLTGGGAEDSRGSSLAALIAIGGAIFAIVAALVRVSTRRRVLPRAEGLPHGAAAGALWGVSDVALKYLTQAPPRSPRADGATAPKPFRSLPPVARLWRSISRSTADGVMRRPPVARSRWPRRRWRASGRASALRRR
jgi:multidrug transporter EmrE-like cation transporter